MHSKLNLSEQTYTYTGPKTLPANNTEQSVKNEFRFTRISQHQMHAYYVKHMT